MKKTAARSPDRFAVILAGGRGERFWPLSREHRPKQLLKLLGPRSLLQQTVDRVRPLVPLKNLLVITTAAQAPAVRRQLPGLPRENLLLEPVGRDTAPAVTLGAAVVGARSPTAVMAVLPADHVIPDEKKFRQVLAEAFDLAGRGQVIVTLGIPPTEPATGYGYIELGPRLPPPHGVKAYRTPFHRALRFKEKPDLDTAREYLASGRYRWNAGMFLWSFVTLTHGLETHQPELHAACRRWFAAATQGPAALTRVLTREYPEINRISIDYALLEKAHNVVCADADFAWDDLGAWPALARHLKTDADGNAVVADCVSVDAARNLIYDARSKSRRTPVALVGLREAVVVLTDDAVLVADLHRAQEVRDLVRRLARSDRYRKLL